MEVANIILEFTKVLVWPLIVIFGLIFYRNSILSLLEKISEISFGGEKGFNLKVKTLAKITEFDKASNASSEISEATSSLILSLPDEAFVYLHSLAKKPLKPKYFPNTHKELIILNSLTDYKIMNQNTLTEFELTKLGRELLSSLNMV